MNNAISLIREKVGSWLAKNAIGRLTAPAGAVTLAAVCTGDPLSWKRIVAALAAVLIVPIAMFVFARTVVAKRSNAANAALLLSFVAFDVMCAAWAVRWSVESWTTALAAVAITAAGLFYNVWIMTFALKLET